MALENFQTNLGREVGHKKYLLDVHNPIKFQNEQNQSTAIETILEFEQ